MFFWEGRLSAFWETLNFIIQAFPLIFNFFYDIFFKFPKALSIVFEFSFHSMLFCGCSFKWMCMLLVSLRLSIILLKLFFFCSCTAFNSSEFLFNVSLFDLFYVRFLQMSSDPCLSDPILE